MKIGALISGGKDSLYSTWLASKKNELVCLISIISENKESYMFHTPNIELTKIQAEAIGLPIIYGKTAGEKEEELEDLEKAVKKAKEKFKIEGVVTGAIASNYQKERIEKICNKLGLKCINPLWKRNHEELLKEMINSEFRFIITSIAAEGFDVEWLGEEITKDNIDELIELSRKHRFSPIFEGGEAESFVVDCPLFKKKIEIIEAETKIEENTGIYHIEKIRLTKK